MNNIAFAGNPWSLLDDAFGFRKPIHSWVRAIANRVEGRFPPINRFASENGAVLDIEAPGKTAADIDIALGAASIAISVKGGADGENYERRFDLEFPVDPDKVKSTLKNGILRIELPRAESAAPRRVAITEG